jgi:hypothetical protein
MLCSTILWTAIRQITVVDFHLTPAALPDAGRFDFIFVAEGLLRCDTG